MKHQLPFNVPILSFLARYWLCLVILVISVWAAQNKELFAAAWMFIYMPGLVVGALLMTALVRHLFYRRTLDEDVRTGDFVKWWDEELSRKEKVRWILGMTIALFLGICHLLSGLL